MSAVAEGLGAFSDAVATIDPRLILAVLLGVLDLWAATLVVLSKATRGDKALWVLVIFACPVIGCFFWFVLGPKWRPST